MSASRRILVVDDELPVREFLSETLKMGGYDVAAAADGYEALDKALTWSPDLILLDVMMPGLDGWQTLERLHRIARTKNIPVVMLTAKSDTEALFRAQERKVLDYFIKPVEPQELIAFIRRALDLALPDD